MFRFRTWVFVLLFLLFVLGISIGRGLPDGLLGP